MNAVSGKNYSNVVCGTLNSDRKTERQAEKTCPPIFYWSKSNRLIDATMSFYGLYVAINQQVTLQNQDPVLNETAELLGLSLKCLGTLNFA